MRATSARPTSTAQKNPAPRLGAPALSAGIRLTVPRAAPFICAAKRRLPEASVLLIGLREALRIEVWSIVQDREHGDLVIVASVRDPILSDQKLTDLGAPKLRRYAAPIGELSKRSRRPYDIVKPAKRGTGSVRRNVVQGLREHGVGLAGPNDPHLPSRALMRASTSSCAMVFPAASSSSPVRTARTSATSSSKAS